MKVKRGSWGTGAPDLSGRWKSVANFTSRLFTPGERILGPTALEAKMGRTAGLDAFGEENILSPKEIKPRIFHPVA
jgi:hypothetical protein